MMKRLLSLVLLCSALAALTGCAGGIEMLNFGRKAPTPPATGRYQFAVSPEVPVLLKMDTVSGDVSYIRLPSNTTAAWQQLPN